MAWISEWQLDAEVQSPLPAGKFFGITDRMLSATYPQVLTKVTHMQHSEPSDVLSRDNLWRNIRGIGTPQDVANEYPTNLSYIGMAQMEEDGFTASQSEQALQLCYNKLVTNLGVTSPNQTGIFGDYFDGLRGCSIDVRFPKTASDPNVADVYTRIRGGMASQSQARKRWTFQRDFTTTDSDYFTGGFFNYRNWYVSGYLVNGMLVGEGQRAYEMIYNLERRYLAIADRRVLTYAWDSFEGIESPSWVYGAFPRLEFDSPSGSLMRQGLVQVPHSIMMEEAFFSILIAEGYLLWGVFPIYSEDITRWRRKTNSGQEFLTQWQPTGGSTVNYNPSNSSHPAYSGINDPFPEVPRTALQGAACGAWMASQLRNRANLYLEYPVFTYSKDGVQQGGYYNGSSPVTGSLGSARLSQMHSANYGQNNIVRSAEARKPICILTTGTEGKGLVWRNCEARMGEVQTIFVTIDGNSVSFTAKGPGLQIFLVP